MIFLYELFGVFSEQVHYAVPPGLLPEDSEIQETDFYDFDI
ncbi:MAG TPA: hypothetical protein VHC47_02850 [Mucilaginibacter sp.]|nr:hypothetical protein [Mucilaginibacter sp.]